MPDVDARLDKVEEGLKDLGERVDKGFARIDERFVEADGRFESLEKEVQKLKVLGEQNATDIKRIAEVQGHHGKKLEQLVEAVAPLKDLMDFVKRVADNHESRIQALEGASPTGTHHA
jgi:DNA repair exonuclease SbcCD ATPase subunit